MDIRTIVIGFVLGVGFLAHGQERPSDRALLASIREGDGAAVERLLRDGASPDAVDEAGATALMHAAAFASADLVRLLLDRGADVTAADRAGATALMWATHDPSTVQLLLDRGARVNAVSARGMTAMMSAALRGRTEVMRMLAAAGGDLRSGTVQAPWPMTLPRVMLTTNDPAMRDLLDRADATPRQLAEWAPPPFTTWLLTAVFSWRPQPAASDTDLVRVLLDAGADANERVSQLTLALPVVSRVALTGDIEAVRVLLERGADPNLAGDQGLTPLMAAAVTDPHGEMVRLLLDRGAVAGARDEQGRTALDWARRLGETDASRTLRAAGAQEMAPPAAPPPGVVTPRTAGVAIETALARLQPAGPGFYEKTRCISCHNQSLPAVAVTLAAARGVAIDRVLASHPTDATLEVWGRSREQMLLGHCSIMGFLPNAAYGLFGLAEEGVAPNPITDAVTSCLSGLQKPDGSWDSGDYRAPLSAGLPFVYTALAVRGLQVYAPPGRRGDTSARLTRAMAFLRTATPADTQEDAFKLLGIVWGGGSPVEIVDQRDRLLRLQRPDGGWGQMPTMPSDAYATGQALYALAVGGLATSDSSYRRGTQHLLQTQLQDGTWFVRSRAIGFQPYVDSGFPHGPDQFISAAATSWAAMALAYGL